MAACDGSGKEENTRLVGETIIHPGQQESVQAASSRQEVSIEVKQHHLFRYPSEWDPRESGKTKGGYLEGKIQLPKVNLQEIDFKQYNTKFKTWQGSVVPRVVDHIFSYEVTYIMLAVCRRVTFK